MTEEKVKQQEVTFDLATGDDGLTTFTMTVDPEMVIRHADCGMAHIALMRTRSRQEMYEQVAALAAVFKDVAAKLETD